MRSQFDETDLKKRVKAVDEVTRSLVRRLPVHVRPNEARVYDATNATAEFGDQPWQGEWNNSFNDTFNNSSRFDD